MTGKDRLTFQTLSNKRERKARSNAKLAHEHLVELSRVFMLEAESAGDMLNARFNAIRNQPKITVN